jgi:hypothetical protein
MLHLALLLSSPKNDCYEYSTQVLRAFAGFVETRQILLVSYL